VSKQLQFALAMMALGGLLVHLINRGAHEPKTTEAAPVFRGGSDMNAVPTVLAPSVESRAPRGGKTPPSRPHAGLMAKIEPSNSLLVVRDVVPGGPADRAEIRANDVVLSVDGVAVSTLDALRALNDRAGAGATVSIAIRRDGELVSRDVTLAPLPEALPSHAEPRIPDGAPSAFPLEP